MCEKVTLSRGGDAVMEPGEEVSGGKATQAKGTVTAKVRRKESSRSVGGSPRKP